MSITTAGHNAGRFGGMRGPAGGALALAFWLIAGAGWAQSAAPAVLPEVGKRVVLDHVVAVVNGELIMQSDVEEEERAGAFQPFRDQSAVTQDELVDRLVDRALILQQAALQPQRPVTDAQVDAELATLRKTIPECASYHCETDAGWLKFVADQGFTLEELRERWRVRMEVLQFIEARFRAGILDTITQAQIHEYYEKTLVPGYEKQHVAPPNEKSVSDRIEEILLQQQVNALLEEWLKSLRAQGTVQMGQAGKVAAP